MNKKQEFLRKIDELSREARIEGANLRDVIRSGIYTKDSYAYRVSRELEKEGLVKREPLQEIKTSTLKQQISLTKKGKELL